MQFVKRIENFSDTDKLLYLILQELKRINSLPCPTREDTEEVKDTVKTITCKICGEQFTNRGLFLSHMREHKKEADE